MFFAEGKKKEMTNEDVMQLDPSSQYEFRFYHGRIECGIIVYRPDENLLTYYLVRSADLRDWRASNQAHGENKH